MTADASIQFTSQLDKAKANSEIPPSVLNGDLAAIRRFASMRMRSHTLDNELALQLELLAVRAAPDLRPWKYAGQKPVFWPNREAVTVMRTNGVLVVEWEPRRDFFADPCYWDGDSIFTDVEGRVIEPDESDY